MRARPANEVFPRVGETEDRTSVWHCLRSWAEVKRRTRAQRRLDADDVVPIEGAGLARKWQEQRPGTAVTGKGSPYQP